MVNFGTLVRSNREKRDMKVRELAAKIHVSAVYITQIEVHNKLPSPEVFDKICTELHLTQDNASVYFQQKYPEVFNRRLIPKTAAAAHSKDTPSEALRSAINKVTKSFPSMSPREQQVVIDTITVAHKKLVLTK